MTFRSIMLCGATALGLASVGQTAAAYTLYFDEATYLAQTGATPITLPNIGNAGSSFTVGDATFSSFGAATDLFSGTSGFEGTFGSDFVAAIPGNDLAISGPENFTVSFSGMITAFSLMIYESTDPSAATPNNPSVCNAPCFDTTFDVQLFRGGTSVTGGTLTITPSDNAVTFLGLGDINGFDMVRITDQTGTSDNEFFGAFTAAREQTPAVPLPAPALLLLGGLAGLGALRKRG